MEVILDNGKRPRGVFLPLEEWEALKYGINKASELYKLMDDLSHPDVFEMAPAQFSDYLASPAQQVVNNALDNGLYISYPAGTPNTFVHRYKDGTQETVKYDLHTGSGNIIKKR
ncbi:hypothetical protein [Mucilaginibacter psychrotolerans]|uniref:Uncharacterized protein n=1 Tax=Mucilaginibacter psychrotolerans TaxID=1524096 RepID=A0A4Y8SCI6_9SPHI|nr:hypothetical protein [Mucilaginibacter psychrotolerans]TFF36144.1 hypothetical protein E2R66_16500 [Mucilaginibacter psychrotolerans]